MRRTRGPAQYHDFEFLAMRAALWLERNPEGFAHRAFNRAPLDDRWREEDAIS